jgi:hypothetical protein
MIKSTLKILCLSITLCIVSIQTYTQNQLPNYHNWNIFFKEFKLSVIKDNETKFLSLSNKTLANLPANKWIKSAKSGFEFSSLQEEISSATVYSKDANTKTIDFASTINCFFEFKLTKNGWRLNNIIYYAD